MVSKTRAVYRVVFILIFALVLGSVMFIPLQAGHALPLDGRSLRIDDPTPGLATSHEFSFSYGSLSDPVGSLVFEYCTSPLQQLPCNAPAGINASGATLSQQSGETGYFIVDAQTNRLRLTRAPAFPTSNPSLYAFDNILNPGGAPATFYVRISTYASVDATGSPVDFGAVVNATSQGVHLTSEVPPILKFCVGLSLEDDCSTADESVVDLGELSTTRASGGTSQMIAGTNAEFGLAIAVYGTTMTSGNNVIPALAVPTLSAPGNAQFGLNLRNNSDPDIGQDPSGIGLANPAAAYNTPNRYVFTNGSTVATSVVATDTRKFTASYIANISPVQTPGVYTATLTYICTATF